jgi:hypothetical protein
MKHYCGLKAETGCFSHVSNYFTAKWKTGASYVTLIKVGEVRDSAMPFRMARCYHARLLLYLLFDPEEGANMLFRNVCVIPMAA